MIRKLPLIPTLIVAVGCAASGLLSFACGLILDSVARGRLEARRGGGRPRGQAAVVRMDQPPSPIPDERPLTHLAVRTIVSQLVSTAAARTTRRFPG